jgi:hypothetical protein
LTGKLNIELREKIGYVLCIEHCNVWLRNLELSKLGIFEMCCWRRMEKIKWSEKVIIEQVLERIRLKRIVISNYHT